MMRLVLCPHCKDLRAVVRFRKDDPVLDCGHVVTTGTSGMAESLAVLFNSLITAKVRSLGGKVSRRYAARLVAEDIDRADD